MWVCKTCNREFDDWVDACYTCNTEKNKNDLQKESQQTVENKVINSDKSKFRTLRDYSKLIVSVGYILVGVEVLFTLLVLNNLYNISGIELMLIMTVTAISVALTIVIFTLFGHLILVFLDIEENTRHTSEKLDKLFYLIEKTENHKSN